MKIDPIEIYYKILRDAINNHKPLSPRIVKRYNILKARQKNPAL